MIAHRIAILIAFASALGGGAVAQSTSATVTAGPLRGTAQAGPDADLRDNGRDRAQEGADDQKTGRDCSQRSVTVRAPNGSASASASSSNGSAVVAGAGSPGSRTTYDDCERTDSSSRDGDK